MITFPGSPLTTPVATGSRGYEFCAVMLRGEGLG